MREVTLKAPPIYAKKDTISYGIASFVKPGDVHLEDVLKKLPGIKVADNGAISYQGKAINKFYIEGKDLLGKSYNQATRNMPVDAVTTVEVIENHQPVKMLQGRQFSDNAALNIKIDNAHKLYPFGEVEGGIGGSPIIWNNRIFLTQIFEKSQLLVTGKMNNNGVDISGETKEHIDVTDLDAYEPIMSSILSESAYNQTLPQNRYIRNKSYSTGINYLTKVSSDATLRFNILLYGDHSTQSNTYEHTYGGIEKVKIAEVNRLKQNTLTILPIIKYELNNNKAYISNEFRYSVNRGVSSNTLETNGVELFEKIKNKPSYFQNYFTSAFTLKNQVVQIKSFLRYFDRKEMLEDTSDSIALYNVSERFATQSFVTKNMISTSLPLWKNNFKIATQVYYQNSIYDYEERARNQTFNYQFLPSYDILLGSERILSIEIPVKWLHVKHAYLNDSETRNAFLFAPSIYLKYKLTNKWKFVVSASMNADNATADFYSPYILRTGYRTLYHPNNRVFLNTNKRASVRFSYSNLATMFFSNLSISYTDDKRENFTNYDYTDLLTEISSIKGHNHHRMLMLNAAADKSFTSAGVSLKSNVTYNQMSYLISQSGIQTNNKSNVLSADISLIYQKMSWLRLSMGMTGTLYWEHNNLYHSNKIKSLVTHTSLYIFPTKTSEVKIKYQNYTNEISESHYKNCGLFDMDTKYKVSKKWETGVSVSNILNARHYTVTQDTGINTFYSNLPLRGREFLFKITYRI